MRVNSLIGLLSSTVCVMAMATPAQAQERQFNIPAGTLKSALDAYGRQSGRPIIYKADEVRSVRSNGYRGTATSTVALDAILANTGFSTRPDSSGAVAVVRNGPIVATDPGVGVEPDQAAEEAEIVVTATRRSESLLEVPQSLEVLTADALTDAVARSITDYSGMVPGLQMINIQPGGWNIQVIRGVSTGIQTTSATIGTYFDETPLTAGSLSSFGSTSTFDPDLFDIERIEVLKGPQGTLYGASAMGGVIRYITTAPNLKRFEVKAEVTAESVSDGGFGNSQRAVVNIPLVDDELAVRFSVFRTAYPGFIDNVSRGQEDINEAVSKGGRFSALWTPSNDLSLRLTSYYQRLKSDSVAAMDVDPLTLQPIWGDLLTARKMLEPTDAETVLHNLTLDYDLGWATILSSSSYSLQDVRNTQDSSFFLGSFFALFIGGNAGSLTTHSRTKKLTQELRFTSSGEGPIQWIAGLYYTNEDAKARQVYDHYNVVGANDTLIFPNAFTASLATDLDEMAAFATLTYNVSPSFDVQAGLRYSNIKQDFTQTNVELAHEIGCMERAVPHPDHPVGDQQHEAPTHHRFVSPQ